MPSPPRKARSICGRDGNRFMGRVSCSVTNSSVKLALASVGWSKKVTRHRAKEQNLDLRGFYMHNLSDFQSYHLVYIDESGCDKRIGLRQTGWSPLGTAPLQVANFHARDREDFYSRQYSSILKDVIELSVCF